MSTTREYLLALVALLLLAITLLATSPWAATTLGHKLQGGVSAPARARVRL